VMSDRRNLQDAVAAANAISCHDQVDEKSLVLMEDRIKEAVSRLKSAVQSREGEEDDFEFCDVRLLRMCGFVISARGFANREKILLSSY